MTPGDFAQLSGFEKTAILKKNGVLLSNRTVGGDRIYLYAVYHFYVELLYELSNPHRKGLIVQKVFENTDDLDPYLAEVDLEWIYAS
jgi:hypothetical protein